MANISWLRDTVNETGTHISIFWYMTGVSHLPSGCHLIEYPSEKAGGKNTSSESDYHLGAFSRISLCILSESRGEWKGLKVARVLGYRKRLTGRVLLRAISGSLKQKVEKRMTIPPDETAFGGPALLSIFRAVVWCFPSAWGNIYTVWGLCRSSQLFLTSVGSFFLPLLAFSLSLPLPLSVMHLPTAHTLAPQALAERKWCRERERWEDMQIYLVFATRAHYNNASGCVLIISPTTAQLH